LRKDIESSNWFDGAVVIRFLAAEDIPVEKAVIDAGIASHLYPKLIFVKDWIMIMLGT